MTSYTTVCLALVLLVALNEASRIRITANTFTIDPSSTQNLVIKCVVENTGIRDFTKIFEIQLKRGGQIVAVFNEASSPLGLDPVAVAHVSGDLSGTSGNKALLQVTYNNPPAELAGVYVCDAVGLDDHNHNREVEGKVQISLVQPQQG